MRIGLHKPAHVSQNRNMTQILNVINDTALCNILKHVNIEMYIIYKTFCNFYNNFLDTYKKSLQNCIKRLHYIQIDSIFYSNVSIAIILSTKSIGLVMKVIEG